MDDLWVECIGEAFEDAGIVATQEQMDTVASWAEGLHNNWSMACGHGGGGSYLQEENARLKRELQAEREKVICDECGGRGDITTQGPYHSGTSSCWKCRGEGRHSL